MKKFVIAGLGVLVLVAAIAVGAASPERSPGAGTNGNFLGDSSKTLPGSQKQPRWYYFGTNGQAGGHQGREYRDHKQVVFGTLESGISFLTPLQ